MKKNIKIVRNELNPNIPNPPDFDVMVKNTKALKLKLLAKKIIIFSGIAIAASVILILTVFAPKNQLTETTLFAENPIINPPSKTLIIEYDTLFVDVRNGDTITFNGCTQIIVPPNGIVTQNGDNIESTKILYREFQNQTDIMLSGIPMTYDSAGTQYLFESGGMFEIKSLNPNEKINQETAMSVKMCSHYQQEGFNVYQLDESNGKWNYIEPVKTEPLITSAAPTPISNKVDMDKGENISIPDLFDNTIKEMPKEEIESQGFSKKVPELVSDEEFTIYVEPSQIEALKLYENILFKPLASEINRVKKIPQDLDYLKVEETKENGVYLLTFYVNNKVEKVKCTPVFNDAKDYNKALAEFKKEEKAFKEEQLQKVKELEKKQKEAEINREKQVAEMKQRNIENALKEKDTKKSIDYSQMVVAFSVNSFGYYNSDRPFLPRQSNKNIEFVVENIFQSIPQLYQYYTTRNAVMVNYCMSKNTTSIGFSNQDDCILIAVLNDGNSIAMMSQQEFRKAVIENRQNKIVLKKVDREFKNAIELNEYIKSLIEQ
jgi:hypothetical protein